MSAQSIYSPVNMSEFLRAMANLHESQKSLPQNLFKIDFQSNTYLISAVLRLPSSSLPSLTTATMRMNANPIVLLYYAHLHIRLVTKVPTHFPVAMH
jgi:hypothetical protein